MNNNLPWIEKYRPEYLNNIISHKSIIETLIKLAKINKIPNMIFYGTPGTGKTTTILAFAKELYKEYYKSMILELNCSDERGISVVRDLIKNFSSKSSMLSLITDKNIIDKKLVILDEADSMTYDAQYTLKNIIDNYQNSTRFCFICNYITKIIPSISSRCHLFRFCPIDIESQYNYLTNIEKLENINITDEAKFKLIELSEGDMRKSLNLFQTLHNTNSKITFNEICNIIGYPLKEDLDIFNSIYSKNNIKDIYKILLKFQTDNCFSNNDIIKEILQYFIKNIDSFQLSSIIFFLDNLALIETNIVNNINNNQHLLALSSLIYKINNEKII